MDVGDEILLGSLEGGFCGLEELDHTAATDFSYDMLANSELKGDQPATISRHNH